VSASLAHLRSLEVVERIWIVGFGTGGAVGLEVAAGDADVAGMAVVATPADFDDWSSAPDSLLAHARSAGAITDPDFPDDPDRWRSDLRAIRASAAAERFYDRPLLVLHGSEDHAVPQFDARMVADAHGDAELRIISSAGHQLRHDPRAVAVLLGWLERERNERPEARSVND
jgi:putative redox protein